MSIQWTPDQFWEYVGGLVGDFERDQMRDMLANCGLSILAQSPRVEELEGALSDALCELSSLALQVGVRTGGSVHRAQLRARAALAVTRPDRHCQKCGCATKGEEALVNGQIWCHPCADNAPDTSQPGNSQ